MQLIGSLRSKSITCNVRETDCNYYYVRCYNKIEDDNLLWMYTSDLVKFWIELYTILLILGEIWSKGSNLTSLLLVDVFAEVAQVNAEALNIKSHQPWQKHFPWSAGAKCIFIKLPRHLICRGKKCWKSRAVKQEIPVLHRSIFVLCFSRQGDFD